MVKHHHGSVTEAISLPLPSCTSYLRSSRVVLCLSGQSRAFSCFFLFWEKRTGVGRERKSDLFSSERIATSCVIMASWPLFNVFCEAYGACARRAFTLCPTRRDSSSCPAKPMFPEDHLPPLSLVDEVILVTTFNEWGVTSHP
jgi:hypothetical protein